MTGPQHYAEAERQIGVACAMIDVPTLREDPVIAALTNAAQVHATLAVAAAIMAGKDATDNASWIHVLAARPL